MILEIPVNSKIDTSGYCFLVLYRLIGNFGGGSYNNIAMFNQIVSR